MKGPSRRLPWTLILVGMTLVAATLACSSLSPAEPTATTAPVVAPTLAPLPTLAPVPTSANVGGGTATVTMINQSGETICEVNISPSTDQYWREDWLGSSESVANGQSRTFEVDQGTVDMRARDCSDGTIEEEWQVSITASGYQWTVEPRAQIPTGPATLRLVNNLSTAVCYVQISASTEQYWGADWLGSTETIAVGASRDFPVPPGDTYDLRAMDCNQNVLSEQYGIEITDTLTTLTLQ